MNALTQVSWRRTGNWRTGILLILLSATGTASADSDQGLISWTGIVEAARPAVVTIETETRQGSGFLVRPDGTIITNHHVIADSDHITVLLGTGEAYNHVIVLRTEPARDLAILRVEGFDLPVLPLGNSNDCEVGEPVLAIGAPKGLGQTVTSGLVSAIRVTPGGSRVIQTEVPASPGSSGGPLINRDGEAIGIITFKQWDGENLNFAIPINYAQGLLSVLDAEIEEVAERVSTTAAPSSPREISPASTVVHTGVLVAGYGVEEVYSLLFVELLNYFGANSVRIANRPGTFIEGEGDESIPLPMLFAQARELRADALLFLTTGDNSADIQCFDAQERLLWSESLTVRGVRDATVVRNLMEQLRVRLAQRIGSPGLPIKSAPGD